MRDDRHTRWNLAERMGFHKGVKISSFKNAIKYDVFKMRQINMAIGIVCNDGDDLDRDEIKECISHMEWERDDLEIKLFYFLNEDGVWKMYQKGIGIIPFNKDNNYNEFRYVKNVLFLCGVFSNLGGYKKKVSKNDVVNSILFDCFGEIEPDHEDCMSCKLRNACLEEKCFLILQNVRSVSRENEK